MTCPICSSVRLQRYPEIEGFCRITSDGKPFTKGLTLQQCVDCGFVSKPVTPELSRELGQIYSSYDIFSGGVEQLIFDPSSGRGVTRSERILRYVFASYQPKSLLDYGCGKGFLLEQAYAISPTMDIYGLEQNQRNAEIYQKIDGVKEVFYALPKRRFDLITLVHVLEHFTDPIASLRDIQSLMDTDSLVVFNVPNAEQNPFDFMVADHISHFNEKTLTTLLRASGLEIVEMMTDFIKKELIAICRLGTSFHTNVAEFQISKQLQWISNLGRMGQELSVQEPINIFGSSQAAIWVASNLREGAVNCFVDEDPTKIGRVLLDKPIVSPDAVDPNVKTLMCLPTSIAHLIQQRLQLPNCIVPSL